MTGGGGGGHGRVASFVLAVALLAVTVLLLFLPAPPADKASSALSTSDAGRRAICRLLQRLDGIDAAVWTRAPGLLTREDQALYLPGVPAAVPGYEAEAEAEADGDADADAENRGRIQNSRRLRDPLHYRRFIEEGGTLITALSGGRDAFLRDELEIGALAELKISTEPTDEPVVAILRSGERIELDLRERSYFESLHVVTPFEVLVADEEGRGLVLELPLGRGRVVLLTVDELFDNARVGARENGLLLVRLLEGLAIDGALLFDEYALGGWVPDTPLELAFARGSAGFSIHLLLLVGLVLWMVAWVGAFPRDPEPLRQLSPLARAEGIAGLLVGAKRWKALGAMLQRGVLRRLVPRAAKMPASAASPSGPPPVGSDANAEEPALAPSTDTRDLDRVLRPLAADLQAEGGLGAMRELFARPTATADEFEELARQLARLERRIEGTGVSARTTPAGAGRIPQA